MKCQDPKKKRKKKKNNEMHNESTKNMGTKNDTSFSRLVNN